LKSDADGKAIVAKDEGNAHRRSALGQRHDTRDGRKLHDMYLLELKKPEQSKHPWDYMRVRAMIPAAEAFRPLKEGGCSLVGG
jgi:branched-chain amino acid transport system substrate-binding protein